MKKFVMSLVLVLFAFFSVASVWPTPAAAQVGVPFPCQLTYPACDGWCIIGSCEMVWAEGPTGPFPVFCNCKIRF